MDAVSQEHSEFNIFGMVDIIVFENLQLMVVVVIEEQKIRHKIYKIEPIE